MSIIRNKLKSDFSQIPNNLFLDNRLSNGAKIVMCYLLSKPDGWVINNADVKKNLDIKRNETIASYWKELINTGWIFRQKIKNDTGKFENFQYTLHNDLEIDKPCTILSEPVLSEPEKPYLRKNRTLNKTDLLNNINTSNITHDIIDYFCSVTGNNSTRDKNIIRNIKTVLKDYSYDDCIQVIDYIVKDQWYIDNGFVTLSTIFKPTKFFEKLEKSNLHKDTFTGYSCMEGMNMYIEGGYMSPDGSFHKDDGTILSKFEFEESCKLQRQQELQNVLEGNV